MCSFNLIEYEGVHLIIIKYAITSFQRALDCISVFIPCGIQSM